MFLVQIYFILLGCSVLGVTRSFLGVIVEISRANGRAVGQVIGFITLRGFRCGSYADDFRGVQKGVEFILKLIKSFIARVGLSDIIDLDVLTIFLGFFRFGLVTKGTSQRLRGYIVLAGSAGKLDFLLL